MVFAAGKMDSGLGRLRQADQNMCVSTEKSRGFSVVVDILHKDIIVAAVKTG